jgi:hypothetical protein
VPKGGDNSAPLALVDGKLLVRYQKELKAERRKRPQLGRQDQLVRRVRLRLHLARF